MKKGRKELPVLVENNEMNNEAVRQSLEANDMVVLATQAFSSEAAEAHQAFGRLQMAQGFADISRAAQIKLYAQIQEQKLFRHLPVKHQDGTIRPAKNFQEFCDLSHRQGYSGVMEEIQYFRTLGYPIYEALKNLDLGRKHFRIVFKMSEDERHKLVDGEAVDLTDPDAVREYIEELEAEKDQAQAALTEAQADNEAKDRLLSDKDKKINKLTMGRQFGTPMEREFEDARKAINDAFDKAALACAELARVGEATTGVEFDGVENENDALVLRAQLANYYYDLSEQWLEQSVGLVASARMEQIEPLLSMARKRLPDDIKAKIFSALESQD